MTITKLKKLSMLEALQIITIRGQEMTKGQKQCRAGIIQDLINETKEMVYKGELDPSLYFSRLAGIFCCEIMGFYDCELDTDLDIEKIGGGKNA